MLAVGGVIGPVAFVAAWLLAGLSTRDYSSMQNAISDLGAAGAPTQLAMTTGFVVFGAGAGLYAHALRNALDGPAWVTMAASALAAVGLAATPTGSPTINTVHCWFAITLASAIALTPMLASGPLLRSGRDGWALASLFVGIIAFTCLLATLVGPERGFLQRAGLGAVDVWIVVTAVAIMRNGRLTAP